MMTEIRHKLSFECTYLVSTYASLLFGLGRLFNCLALARLDGEPLLGVLLLQRLVLLHLLLGRLQEVLILNIDFS